MSENSSVGGQVVKFRTDHFIGPIALDFTADASAVASSADPSVTYNKKHFHFDIPQGAKGDKGDKGDKGATGSQGPQGIQGIQG